MVCNAHRHISHPIPPKCPRALFRQLSARITRTQNISRESGNSRLNSRLVRELAPIVHVRGQNSRQNRSPYAPPGAKSDIRPVSDSFGIQISWQAALADSRDARIKTIRHAVCGNYAPRCDHTTVTNADTGQNRHSCTDPATLTDHNRQVLRFARAVELTADFVSTSNEHRLITDPSVSSDRHFRPQVEKAAVIDECTLA